MSDVTALRTAPSQNVQSGVKPPAPAQADIAKLRHSAEQFEAVFLAEMLKHTGLGRMPDTFNGGAGEAAFSDFLTREYAEQIAKSRSTGISDQVFEILRQRSGL